MFAHQVIEDLKQLRDRIDPGVAEYWENCITLISQATHFHFGDITDLQRMVNEDYMTHSPFIDDLGQFVNPPARICWFDYFWSVPTYQSPMKAGSLIIHHADWNAIALQQFVYLTREMEGTPEPLINRWMSSGNNFYIKLGAPFEHDEEIPVHGFTAIVDSEAPTERTNILVKSEKGDGGFEQTKMSGILAGEIRYIQHLNAMLMLINCRNIGTDETRPPKKMVKARQKKKRQPPFTYRTLKLILPGKKSAETKGKGETAGERPGKTRLHFRRGHFKTYTNANPLFGKWTGRYWWTPNMVGSEKAGRVEKAYQVIRKK